MPAGSTRVTVTLLDEDGGTRLTLRHENLPSESLREGHDVAWNTYLPRLVVRRRGRGPAATRPARLPGSPAPWRTEPRRCHIVVVLTTTESHRRG